MTDEQSKELKKLCDPTRIVNELKSHLNLCSGSDIICKVKELKEENDEYKLRDENTTTYKELEKENKQLKEENEEYIQTEKVFDENEEKMKKELVMMYSIIMNDGVKSEIPFLNCADTISKLKSNITLMLEKFKTMGEENDKLIDDNEKLKEKYDKLKSDNSDLRKQYQEEFQKQEYKTMVKEKNNGYTRCSIEVEKLKKLLIPNIDHPHLKQILVNNLDALNSLQIENSKLKEEIEELKENRDYWKTEWEKDHEQRVIEQNNNEKLKEEIKDKETIIEYINTELEKYKTTLKKFKTECDKVKEIKGIMVNEDKTIITINDVELTIGDKFCADNTIYTLKQIYIGKSGKYSLRTDKNTIRLGNKYITGKDRIYKEC